MTFLYFAYGLNVLSARLQARCKSTQVIGTATAHGFDLELSKPSKDGTGKARLITAAELHALDRAEHPGYEPMDDFTAEIKNARERIGVQHMK